MMRRHLILLLITANCACAAAQAQFADSLLFAAYLDGEMNVWDIYLHSVSFNTLSTKEKKRYLSYEYGYVATAIDNKATDTKQHIDSFEQHIALLRPQLPEATALTYRSALAAYKAKSGKMFLNNAIRSYTLAQEAYAADKKSEIALTLKGNIDFYAPPALGGDKKSALRYFREAQELYEASGDTLTCWNYVATRLCIIQCEDKIGNTCTALRLAEGLLRSYPSFTYLRDSYIPELCSRCK